jgi:carbon-monoxide dehydrogenase medium subunit
MSFSVHHPASVADAVALARQFGEKGRFLAGGTDLVIQINRKRLAPQHLIDITRLADLSGVTEDAQTIRIGALTTHKAVERHPLFRSSLLALPEAARVVGGHQVRNVATIGGNIANASPAADTVAPLLALEAELTLIGPSSPRRTPLEKFLLGPGRTERSPDELLEAVHIAKLPRRSATAFLKAGRRKAMEISVVCVAARITLGEDGRCATARIALGAVGATAFRPRDAERSLEGGAVTPDKLREAGRLAAEACNPIDDVRASARYRRLLVETLVPRAIERCRARIAEAGG